LEGVETQPCRLRSLTHSGIALIDERNGSLNINLNICENLKLEVEKILYLVGKASWWLKAKPSVGSSKGYSQI
jgi:hypothetical protein